METAHQQYASNESDAEIVGAAGRVFGVRIATAIAAGSWEYTPLDGPSPGAPADQSSLRRLRDALAIADLLLDVEADETVRSWFAGKNPILDDRAPAIVISDSPEQVRFAARDLIANG